MKSAKFWNTEIQEELKRRFEHTEGVLYHKTNSPSFNGLPEGYFYRVGDKVKTKKLNYGHLAIDVYNKVKKRTSTYLVHRIVWFLEYGTQVKVIDHIDGNPENNNPPNLREATQQQNMYNKKKMDGCTSIYNGVTHRKGSSKRPWQAQIRINGYRKYIGSFATQEEAARAYDEYAKNHHGEFASLNFS